MRLIDAEGSELQTQLKIIREAEYQIYGSGSWGFTAKCEHAIEDAPTVFVEPKSGKWINVVDGIEYTWGTCNKCGAHIPMPYKYYEYCPHCGMKNEVENG